jgi:hypothetical protein
MRFTRDLRESKVIRLASRTQFRISLYCNNGTGVAFFSSTKEFYLCFHSVLPAFHSSYKRALSYCSWETKIERRGSARRGASECEKYVLRGMESRGNVKGRAVAAASFVKNKSSRDMQKWEIIPTST